MGYITNSVMNLNVTNRDSMAYPPRAQDESIPLHVPIAIGSAVWYTCVIC